MKVTEILKSSVPEGEVASMVEDYTERFKKNDDNGINERLKNASTLTHEYYSLVTDFYLNAWGRMFHFGVRKKGQNFKDSLLQHELFLADKLQLKAGEKCLDIGCGVGGPMINIAKNRMVFITGINNSSYQIQKAKHFLNEEGLESNCSLVQCDWMQIPLPDESFDKAYSIEASCHAADRRAGLFREIHRLLKPGAKLALYEWALTSKFNPNNPMHKEIKHGIEIGNALSNLNFSSDVTNALEQSGFEILESCDRVLECDPETPWYLPLKGESRSIQLIRMSPIGRMFMRNVMRILETTRVLPEGTFKVSKLLNVAGESLVKAGEEGIFTPMLFLLAQKNQ